MKLTKFRVQYYKSILDSGECYLADGVTILAGKNESGKTSLLEALEDFNPGAKIREKAIPITHSDKKPAISVWFEINRGDIEEILGAIDFESPIPVPETVELCIVKTYPNGYAISGEFMAASNLLQRIDYIAQVKAAYSEFATASIKEVGIKVGVPLPTFNLTDLPATLSAIQGYTTAVAPHLSSWSVSDREVLEAGLAKMANLTQVAIANAVPPLNRFWKELQEYLPNFILFSSFDDVFPNTIPLGSLKDNEWIRDLQEITDIDVETISGTNDRAKVTHKRYLNAAINSDFAQFWTQDLSQLFIDWDNEKLSFWIEEGGHYYEPEIRSQGRRWHLAFYVRVSARAKENIRNVILIDEPGLYLHATAQRDILRNLESASDQTPVIISTHSPYLIEPEKLERIRLVQKIDAEGTTVANKVHSVADKETLTPILTAIGLELVGGIVNVERLRNVVVEGASDCFYLSAFKSIQGWKDINFVFGGSAGNMPKIGSILQGWGCQVVYLYDNDQGYADAIRCIKKDWLTTSPEVVGKLNVSGAIEDIFSPEDFGRFVLGEAIDPRGAKNSELLRGKDKVLKAKKFLESVSREQDRVALDDRTTANLQGLADVLNGLFSVYARH